MAAPPGILEVRCAGCGETLEVDHGLTEFACPDCGMAQALPPELMPPRPRRALPLPGRAAAAVPAAPAPARVACVGCGAVLSVPHGHGRFACPLCGVEIAAPVAAAVVSVVAPPAAVPITSYRPPKPPEQVQVGASSQSTLVGWDRTFLSGQTHGKYPKNSLREESFSSFRVDTTTKVPEAGRLQNDPVNPSVHRKESPAEPHHGNIASPGKKKYKFSVGSKSQARKLQEEHDSPDIHVSLAQRMPSHSEGEFPDDMVTMHNKRTIGHVPVPSIIEHVQINSPRQVCDDHQAGEISSDVVHADPGQLTGSNKKSAKGTKRKHKREGKSSMDSSNECHYLRRSKRLSKGSPDIIDIEPIQKQDASPNQNLSESPQIERAIDDTNPSSPMKNQCPQPAFNHGMSQAERLPHFYNQAYSPETRWTLPNPSSNSWHEHAMPQESFDGLDSSDEEVHSNPSENHNQDMDGQLAQEACTGKNHLEQAPLKPHKNNLAEHGRENNNSFISSSDGVDHQHLSSGTGTRNNKNLVASCSRLAALLSVPAATLLPTISSPPSLERLPPNCSIPTTPQHQPSPLYSQEAWHGDMLSVSVSKSSKKRRGRTPAVLMEPRKEAERPMLTPNGTDNWNVHPPCPKVASTLCLLIKQNYPGTYVSMDTNGNESCELVVYHWHQCPSDIRTTILDEFLKRYKWSPGQEEQCQKIFDRKAVRQLVNLFCYEKQRAREELSAKKAKRSLAVGRAIRATSLEEEDGREDSEEQQGDESVLTFEHDDPLKWKPFVPEWMQPKWWEQLCDHWAKDEVMKVSYQKRKNRSAGIRPCNTSGSRNVAMHHQLMSMDNGGKLVSDMDPSTNIHRDKGGLVDKKTLQTEVGRYRHTEDARDTQLDPDPVQEHAGGCKRGRYYRAPVVSKKAQIDSVSKSSPGCFSKQGPPLTFTQEQVQQMINQALHGLNETWEKKFVSLEQNMRNVSSSRVIPEGATGSLAAVAGDKQCQLARQDTLDSVDGEKDPSARDDVEHWS